MKAATATKPKIAALGELVDELGDLEKRVAPFKADMARIEALRKLLRASCPELPSLETRTIYGKKYGVLLGAKELKRTVNIKKLQALLSLRVFCELVSATLEAIKGLAPEIQAQVIDSKYEGSRSLTVIEGGKP